jgi:hypothetical protein
MVSEYRNLPKNCGSNIDSQKRNEITPDALEIRVIVKFPKLCTQKNQASLEKKIVQRILSLSLRIHIKELTLNSIN